MLSSLDHDGVAGDRTESFTIRTTVEAMSKLHTLVIDWFNTNARDLPWRDSRATPWAVMVSEFMLQQTPVVRVLPVWQAWMQRWPTPHDLAAATPAEVLRAWGRLGYPRRALRLHEAAKVIVEQYGGEVPSQPEQLLRLPGVGDYTAAAIASFAFGIPATVVDTNIRRVHARAVTGTALPKKSLSATEMRLAEELMPTDAHTANQWNAAVMELGALVCTARAPRCVDCPLVEHCAWVAAGKPEPTYTPKGQAWAGTDRQLRGAIMAVLRAQDIVPEEKLRETVVTTGRLGDHTPDDDQWSRCIAGLVADSLIEKDGEHFQLPN